MTRRLRTALLIMAASAGLAAWGMQPAHAATAAPAAGCHTTYRTTHSMTSTGSQRWEWMREISCGSGHLTEWRAVAYYSYTGMHYTEQGDLGGPWWHGGTEYKVETSVSHYTEGYVKTEVTARGVVEVSHVYIRR